MQFLAVVLTKIVGQGTFQQRCDNLFHLSNQRRFFSCVPLKGCKFIAFAEETLKNLVFIRAIRPCNQI